MRHVGAQDCRLPNRKEIGRATSPNVVGPSDFRLASATTALEPTKFRVLRGDGWKQSTVLAGMDSR
jgi:hypothetical protein